MKMTMIECDSKETFVEAANEQLAEIGERLFSFKAQRNLFYSLSGSMGTLSENMEGARSLKESYIAFIVWREVDFDGDDFDGEV